MIIREKVVSPINRALHFFKSLLKRFNWNDRGSISFLQDPEEVGVGDVAAQSFAGVATLITKTFTFPAEVFDFMAKVTVAPTVTAPVIALTLTPLGGAESGAKATITIPVGGAIGSIWRNKLADNGLSFRANVGDVLKIKVTTAATAGTGNVWVVIRRSQQQLPTLAAATYNEVLS